MGRLKYIRWCVLKSSWYLQAEGRTTGKRLTRPGEKKKQHSLILKTRGKPAKAYPGAGPGS